VLSEEERSIESEDLQKDEISDLFDHSAEDQEGSSRENPSDLTHAPALGVPPLHQYTHRYVSYISISHHHTLPLSSGNTYVPSPLTCACCSILLMSVA
jgi:hypothetical protein